MDSTADESLLLNQDLGGNEVGNSMKTEDFTIISNSNFQLHTSDSNLEPLTNETNVISARNGTENECQDNHFSEDLPKSMEGFVAEENELKLNIIDDLISGPQSTTEDLEELQTCAGFEENCELDLNYEINQNTEEKSTDIVMQSDKNLKNIEETQVKDNSLDIRNENQLEAIELQKEEHETEGSNAEKIYSETEISEIEQKDNSIKDSENDNDTEGLNIEENIHKNEIQNTKTEDIEKKSDEKKEEKSDQANENEGSGELVDLELTELMQDTENAIESDNNFENSSEGENSLLVEQTSKQKIGLPRGRPRKRKRKTNLSQIKQSKKPRNYTYTPSGKPRGRPRNAMKLNSGEACEIINEKNGADIDEVSLVDDQEASTSNMSSLRRSHRDRKPVDLIKIANFRIKKRRMPPSNTISSTPYEDSDEVEEIDTNEDPFKSLNKKIVPQNTMFKRVNSIPIRTVRPRIITPRPSILAPLYNSDEVVEIPDSDDDEFVSNNYPSSNETEVKSSSRLGLSQISQLLPKRGRPRKDENRSEVPQFLHSVFDTQPEYDPQAGYDEEEPGPSFETDADSYYQEHERYDTFEEIDDEDNLLVEMDINDRIKPTPKKGRPSTGRSYREAK